MFNRKWIYKVVGNDIEGLIVDTEDDYKLLMSQGYVDTHKEAKEILAGKESFDEVVSEPVKVEPKKRVRRTMLEVT